MFEFKFGRRNYIPIYLLNPPPIVISTNVRLYNGCRVHLNSRNGTYVVDSYTEHTVTITCKKWIDEFYRNQRPFSRLVLHRSDIKCLHGHDKFR